MWILDFVKCNGVSGGYCIKTLTIGVDSKTEFKMYPLNGLFLLGSRVEDLKGNIVFSGTTGSFTYESITYSVKQVITKDFTTTEYIFSYPC